MKIILVPSMSKKKSNSFIVSTDEFRASLYCLMIYSAKRELKASEPIVRYLYYRTKILDLYPEVTNILVQILKT